VFSTSKTNKRYDFARRGEVPDDHMKLCTEDGPGHIIFGGWKMAPRRYQLTKEPTRLSLSGARA
jgi:hypothetical protein